MPYLTTVSPRVKFLQGSASWGFMMSSVTKVNLCFIYAEHCPLFSWNKTRVKPRSSLRRHFLEEEYFELHDFMGLEGTGQTAFRNWNNFGAGRERRGKGSQHVNEK